MSLNEHALLEVVDKYTVHYDVATDKIYASYRGNMYDVEAGYLSVTSGRKMGDQHIEFIESCGMLERLKQSVDEAVALRVLNEVKDDVVESVAKVSKDFFEESSVKTASAIEKALEDVSGSVEVECDKLTQTADGIIKSLSKTVDSYIHKEYGNLPKVVKIIKGKTTKEIKGIAHNMLPAVIQYVEADIPVFMVGPAGTGKNVIAKQVAEATGRKFRFTNAVTDEYRLTGFIDANGSYHETEFYRAMRDGDLFFLDELDASIPEVLVILNAAIANRYFAFPNGHLEAHKNFRIIAAGNTYGNGASMEYSGRYQLDGASLNRFANLRIDYDPVIEEALADGDEQLIRLLREFRMAVHDKHVKAIVSYRTFDMCSKMSQTRELDDLLRETLLRGISTDTLNTIMATMSGKKEYDFSGELEELPCPFGTENRWWDALNKVRVAGDL